NRAIRASGSKCFSLQAPRSCGEIRPSGDTAAASVNTSPAPPTARAARWAKCQSLAKPSTEEYWHIGETPIRLGSAMSRSGNSLNKCGMGGHSRQGDSSLQLCSRLAPGRKRSAGARSASAAGRPRRRGWSEEEAPSRADVGNEGVLLQGLAPGQERRDEPKEAGDVGGEDARGARLAARTSERRRGHARQAASEGRNVGALRRVVEL